MSGAAQAPALIAIDWGTTNRRIYLMSADGSLLAVETDGCGVIAMAGADYAAEVRTIRARLGDLPVLCAGPVGSARGWQVAPYCACPGDVPAIADALLWVEPGRTAIVPGLSSVTEAHGDVMRGEEVQLLGAVAAGLAPPDGLLCQPGTHAKWARMASGAVAGFRTAMTGELFALLRQHSLLSEMIAGEATDVAAFSAGVDAAARAMLLTDLFGVRACDLLGLRPRAQAASFASGLLIGSDVREQATCPRRDGASARHRAAGRALRDRHHRVGRARRSGRQPWRFRRGDCADLDPCPRPCRCLMPLLPPSSPPRWRIVRWSRSCAA